MYTYTLWLAWPAGRAAAAAISRRVAPVGSAKCIGLGLEVKGLGLGLG